MKNILSKVFNVLFPIARWIRWRYYYLENFVFDKYPERFKIWLGKNNIISYKRYAAWKNYKNIHEGNRCFIVATGPSLTFEDLELIKDEYSFGVNSIIKILDKTKWKPTYYGIQDPLVFEKLKEEIAIYPHKPIFVSHIIKKKYKLDAQYIPYFMDVVKFMPAYNDSNLITDFSGDVEEKVYSGYSITYSLLQVAVYMGFKEIYLLGADCSYSQEKHKQHFVESGFHDKYSYLAGKKMIDAYKYAKVYADTHTIKIFNATRGGMLEVFERVKLEDII